MKRKQKSHPNGWLFWYCKDLKDFRDFRDFKVVKDYSSLVQLVCNMRRYERERSMAQEITEDGVHKDWDNNRKSNSRIPLNKREYAKGRRYEVAHLKCIRAIQYQGTFRRFLFKYNRWIYIS